ncbi:iron-sulfur cluster assembly protein [Methylovirgula sp. HY1]|uniref:iron-sulfur cluster assembly protein n=1 Tax=Methylovirgula sp. HY1 TaxID=2822761 RepID=UPI001C5AB080|nr:iron-sulfur cluster assembly protein [Methylovirgula sp. HY1]QXX74129.1 Iron-sulfur cluster carrier protein [Methylovirgula sp. HY1]
MAELDTLEAQEAVPNEPQWIFSSDVQQAERDRLLGDMVAAFKTIFDPEIPCDIYELGLIYKVDVDENRLIRVEMTLTAPGCPVAGEITRSVETAIGTVPGTLGVIVNIVFEPPWDQGRMSDEARVSLDML